MSLAGKYIEKTIEQLNNEHQFKNSELTKKQISKHLVSVNKSLKVFLDSDTYNKVLSTIEQEFLEKDLSYENIKVIHDISESVFLRIKSFISEATESQKEKMVLLSNKLDQLNETIDQAGKNISRAPDKKLLEDIFLSISSKQKQISELEVKQANFMESHKRLIREQMDGIRTLDKLTEELSSSDEERRIIEYISGSKKVLSDFSRESAIAKIKDLEREFIKSFCYKSHKYAKKKNWAIMNQRYVIL